MKSTIAKVKQFIAFLVACAAAATAAGCAGPEIDERQLSPETFTASIEQEGATKTLLDAKTGTTRQVRWLSNDAIALYGASVAYTFDGAVLNTQNTAYFTGSGATPDGGKYKAYYPATIYDPTTHKLTFSEEQTYGGRLSDGRAVVSNLPMYAESETAQLQFRNLCSVLNFQLTGEATDKVTEIVVTTSAAGQYLSGEFTIGGTPATAPTMVMTGSSGSTNTVKLKCGSGVALSSTPVDFFVAIPAQTYAAGTLTITVKDGTKTLATLSNSTATAAQEQFQRNTIYEIGKTATNEKYVFNVTDPTDLTYEGGTSTNGKVVSYKYTGTDTPANRTAVAWDVEGYYATAADAAAGTNRLSGIGATYLTAFPTSGTGGSTGENVSITYKAASPTTEDLSAEIRTKLRSSVPKGSALYPYNLANPATGSKASIQETANTYIVNAPGCYSIPLVMGNGIKGGSKNTIAYRQTNFTNYKGTDLSTVSSPLLNDQGGTPTSAHIVWAGADMVSGTNSGNNWTLPSGCITSSTLTIDGESKLVYWLDFQITDQIDQGCIVLAVTDGDDTIMWSWTIWVTDYVPGVGDVECTYDNAGNKVTFMPVNLGWVGTQGVQYPEGSVYVRLRQTGTDNYAFMAVTRPGESGSLYGHNPYYQWGRKDAEIPAIYDPTDNAVYISPLYGRSTTVKDGPATSLSTAIQNPDTHYWTQSGRYDWCSTTDHGWWCAGNTEYTGSSSLIDKATIKTIYDPCPAGYTIPRGKATQGFWMLLDTDPTQHVINKKGDWDRGYLFYNDYRANTSVPPADGRKTIFFPATGTRDYRQINDSEARKRSGGVSRVRSEGIYWLNVPQNPQNYYGMAMYMFVNSFWTTNNRARSYGALVRPAKEEIVTNGTPEPYGPGGNIGF